MMLLAVLVSAGLAVDNIGVTFAPDQPMPHVYIDEPVILELATLAPERVAISVRLSYIGAEASELNLGEIALRGNGAEWFVLEGLPPRRGRVEADVRLDNGTDTRIVSTAFWRVDRPEPGLTLPVGAALERSSAAILAALSGIGVQTLRVSSENPEPLNELQRIKAAGFRTALAVGPLYEQQTAGESAAGLRDWVDRWELGPPADSDPAPLIEELRRIGGTASLALVVEEPDEAAAALDAGLGRDIEAFILSEDAPSRSELWALRKRVEQAGYEGPVVHVRDSNTYAGEDSAGARCIRNLVLNLAVDVRYTEIAPELLIDAPGLGAAYAHVNGAARRLAGAVYAGELPLSPPLYGQVFRNGSDWILVLWSTAAPTPVTLDIGPASRLHLTDALNNAMLVPELLDTGEMSLDIGPAPVYLSGRGGAVLHTAALRMLELESARFLEDSDLVEAVSEELAGIIGMFANGEAERAGRVEFFSLLRAFPDLETRWHDGELARSAAVPAMASLARALRWFAVLEEERGEPFLQTLDETIATCNDYKAEYLTGGGGGQGALERGDWLLGEIHRLLFQAQRTAAQGRTIEAIAIASLAEWRARSLEAAARAAPLSQPGPDQPS